MMSYKYRWHYVVFILFVTILFLLFYVIEPAWQETLVLDHQKTQLLQEESAMMHLSKIHHAAIHVERKSDADRVAALFLLAHQYHVHIHTLSRMNRTHFKSISMHPTHVVMSGEWQSMVAFLMFLMLDQRSLIILDFKYRIQSNHQLLVDLEILFLSQTIKPFILQTHPIPVESLHAIFCDMPYFMAGWQDRRLLVQTPLNQIKMSGFLKQGNTAWSIVSLPGGISFVVGIGEHVGEEGGSVLRISPAYLTIWIDHHQQQVKRYASFI